MAPRKRSAASIPAPRKAADPEADGLSVENATGTRGDTVLDVDATTGQTMRRNPDGSISMMSAGQSAKPFKDTFEANLAMAPNVEPLLAAISVEVLEGIEQDLESRRDWD